MANTQAILKILAKDFPNAKSELNFNNPYELIVAVILSAQCTDKRVNLVTPHLFEVAPTPQTLANLPLEQIEQIIRPCGFYHSKATYLKEMAHDLVVRFGGQVPQNLADLQTLKGVGRKTANVVYAVAFGGQAIAVDTHVFRVSNRLGIVNAKNVLDTEKQLMQAIPQNEWADSHHYILLHGRYVCKAQNPQCSRCSVKAYCKHYAEQQAQKSLVEACKCLGCKNALCQAHCPIGNPIAQITSLVKAEKWSKASQLVRHPFGEICGYVCPHDEQCFGNCVLNGKKMAVDFPQIERTLCAQHPFRWKTTGNKLKGKKVAIVGGGVAGITFASQMYQEGATITIYEKDQLLSTLKLIPNLRLPQVAIQRIIDHIPHEITIVKDVVDSQKLANLQAENDIVYIATGATINYTLGVPGEHLATTSNSCLMGNVAGKVVVVGGGNTAIDCATHAKSLGCDVTVAYRRSQADMPAFKKEIANAMAVGVNFLFNVAPIGVDKNDTNLTLTVAKTVSQGRGALQITDELLTINCDHVVCAVGGSCDKCLFGGAKPQPNQNNQISPNTFVGGDAIGGGLVIKAVQHALECAKYIINER